MATVDPKAPIPYRVNQSLHYPSNLTNADEHPSVIRFGFFERDTPYRDTPLSEIYLYMPESAQNPSTVSWDTEKFGLAGDILRQGASNALKGFSGGGPQQAFDAAAAGAAGRLEEAISQGQRMIAANIGSKIAQLTGSTITGEGLIGQVTGTIPNPYLTAVFRGVDFRSFTFTFKFTPYSEKDCDTIDEIINRFRQYSLPTIESSFLKYPKECEIAYFWKGKENKYLHRFKRAVCTAVDVDYTGAGMFSVMRNGFPSTIVLNTKWSEIQIVTANDIDAAANTGNPSELGSGF